MPNQRSSTRSGAGFSKSLFCLLIVVAIAAGLYFMFRTVEKPLRIRELHWFRAIEVQVYKTVRDKDWYVPEGGRVVSEEPALHHTDRVRDGTDMKYSYNFFKDKWEWKFVQKYKNVPVYKNQFTFDIERWVRERMENASGMDQNPSWPEVVLAENERRGTSTQEYTAIFEYVEDPSRSLTRSYDLASWQELDQRGLYLGRFDAFRKLIEVKPLLLEKK